MVSGDVRERREAVRIASELRPILSKLKRRFREQSQRHELTPSQVAVILRIDRDGPAAVSSLARAEGVRPQSMSAIVKVLQRAGMIVGTPDPGDGRQMLMGLSRTCRKFIEQGRAARHDWLQRAIEQKLSKSEQRRLADAVVLLARLVEE